MIELKVQFLAPGAKLPVCSNPGQDLGYDIFAIEKKVLFPGFVAKIKTGIAVELPGYGFKIWDRSSMAAKGIVVSGGAIDASYRGEIIVMLTSTAVAKQTINVGDKIAQLVPVKSETLFPVALVTKLTETKRGDKGFGSTGS